MGGLVTTATDYACYVAFLLSAWPARDDADNGPARRATVRELGLSHGRRCPPTRAWQRARPSRWRAAMATAW